MILSNSKILWIMQIIIKLTCSISLSSNNFLYSFFKRYKNLTQDEKKSFSSIEKNIIKWEKMHYFNYKQLF